MRWPQLYPSIGPKRSRTITLDSSRVYSALGNHSVMIVRGLANLWILSIVNDYMYRNCRYLHRIIINALRTPRLIPISDCDSTNLIAPSATIDTAREGDCRVLCEMQLQDIRFFIIFLNKLVTAPNSPVWFAPKPHPTSLVFTITPMARAFRPVSTLVENYHAFGGEFILE